MGHRHQSIGRSHRHLAIVRAVICHAVEAGPLQRLLQLVEVAGWLQRLSVDFRLKIIGPDWGDMSVERLADHLSALADVLVDTIPLLDHEVTLAYLPSAGGIRLRAMRLGRGADAEDRYRRLLDLITTKGEEWIITDRDEPLAAVLGRMLAERRLTLATAESCTGGMIGEALTDIPGSSAYYLGGTVTYANSAKGEMLGVDDALIDAHGAVSEQVARAMAEGIRERLGADIAVSVTGIAGPGGGTPEKPVGTVWIGIASARGSHASRHLFGRERAYVRQRASSQALFLATREVIALDREPH